MNNQTNLNTSALQNSETPQLQQPAAPRLCEGGTITQFPFFIQPEILQQIGPARLDKFLRVFAQELSANGIRIPDPESLNGNYFSSVSDLFASRALPDHLAKMLIALEKAASPENAAWLDDAIKRRIPCVSINS